MKKEYFDKEPVKTKEDDENFESSTKCWICDNTFVKSGIKVRDHCPVTGKDRGAAHRDSSVKVSLNCKIPIVLYNPKLMMHMLLCKNLENSILK